MVFSPRYYVVVLMGPLPLDVIGMITGQNGFRGFGWNIRADIFVIGSRGSVEPMKSGVVLKFEMQLV